MRIRPVVAVALSISLAATTLHSTCQAVERTVEFRDGTILKLEIPDGPLPWHTATNDGQVSKRPLDWAKVERLYLVTTPALEKLAEIKGLITDLGSGRYLSRVEAHKNLIERGVHFRGVLETVYKTTSDPEVRWRLEAVLKAMPDDAATAQYNFDLVNVSGSGEELEGDVGDWVVTAKFRGAGVKLDRKSVCRIARDEIAGSVSGEELARVEQIVEDDDALFPKNVTRVDFDRGPGGELLAPGRDLKETFVPLGVTLHTSFKESFVSVEDYNVRGRSGKLCVATHDPLYQGTLTLRFCLPGNAGVPAGVHYVGFWTAYIEPEGTLLEAYDVHNRLIGVVKTSTRGRDFLAVKSRTPIAYVKVTSDEEIDKDFAIDDLVFDPPVTLAEASDPDWTTVLLTSGERLKCRSISRQGDQISMNELSVGVEKVSVPVTDVASLMPATELAKSPADEADALVMLSDGSVIRAKSDDGLRTLAGLEIAEEQLVALWGKDSSFNLPEESAWPEKGAVMIERDKHYKPIPDWKLGKKWIEGEGLSLFDYTYADTPIVWFRRPAKRPDGAGILRLAGGEEYILHDGDAYTLADWSAMKVTLKKGNQTIEVPFDQVLTLRLPRKSS